MASSSFELLHDSSVTVFVGHLPFFNYMSNGHTGIRQSIQGFFSAEDGRVIAGPPKRGLDALKVSVRKDEVWVNYESES